MKGVKGLMFVGAVFMLFRCYAEQSSEPKRVTQRDMESYEQRGIENNNCFEHLTSMCSGLQEYNGSLQSLTTEREMRWFKNTNNRNYEYRLYKWHNDVDGVDQYWAFGSRVCTCLQQAKISCSEALFPSGRYEGLTNGNLQLDIPNLSRQAKAKNYNSYLLDSKVASLVIVREKGDALYAPLPCNKIMIETLEEEKPIDSEDYRSGDSLTITGSNRGKMELKHERNHRAYNGEKVKIDNIFSD